MTEEEPPTPLFPGCTTLTCKIPTVTERGLKEVEGAGLLHCSLNNSITKQTLQSKWEGVRHHASVTGLLRPVPAAHLPHASPPTVLANTASRPLLLPSSQPIPKHFKGCFKGHRQPHDASTPSKSPLLRHLPAA